MSDSSLPSIKENQESGLSVLTGNTTGHPSRLLPDGAFPSPSPPSPPSVESDGSNHYKTLSPLDQVEPITMALGPSSVPSPNADPYFDPLVASVIHVVKVYMDQRTQPQEFAARVDQVAFEKRIL
jgi:hypothetical protein